MKYITKVDTFVSGRYVPANTIVEGDFSKVDPKQEIYIPFKDDPVGIEPVVTKPAVIEKKPTIDELKAEAKALKIKGAGILKTEKSLISAIEKAKTELFVKDQPSVADEANDLSVGDVISTVPPEGVQQ